MGGWRLPPLIPGLQISVPSCSLFDKNRQNLWTRQNFWPWKTRKWLWRWWSDDVCSAFMFWISNSSNICLLCPFVQSADQSRMSKFTIIDPILLGNDGTSRTHPMLTNVGTQLRVNFNIPLLGTRAGAGTSWSWRIYDQNTQDVHNHCRGKASKIVVWSVNDGFRVVWKWGIPIPPKLFTTKICL